MGLKIIPTLFFAQFWIACLSFVVKNQEDDKVIKLQQRASNEALNEAVNQLFREPGNEQLNLDLKLFEANKFECTFCELVIGTSKILSKTNIPRESIVSKIKYFCLLPFVESHVCYGAISMFQDEVFDVLSHTTLRPSEICDVLLTKNCTGKETQSLQWDVELPARSYSQKKDIKHSHVKKDEKHLKVLHLTDIHVDFDYKPYSVINCKEPLCCRSGVPSSHSNSAGFWGSFGHCDIPMWTIEDLFQKLSKEKFDYILWTGDSLSHNIWNQTKEEQLKALYYFKHLFDKYFLNVPVFPALGNHEGVPVNSFPFINNDENAKHPMSWLYEALMNVSIQWLSTEALKTLANGGYYTTLVAPGFRIVSLNMNFCNNLNGICIVDADYKNIWRKFD